jgi:ribosomal protein S2
MKIRAFKSKQILSLYLLKSKTYEQVIAKKTSNLLVRSCLTEILVSFKKSLQIIFNYHEKKKLILFVGLPESLRSKINKSTMHMALSKYSNLQGSVSNVSKDKNSLHDSLGDNLLSIKSGTKPYLIVLVDHTNMDSIVKESYLAKIPLICVNTNYDKKNFFYRNIYKVFISQNLLQLLNNFFFVGLSFLFKQSRIKL